MKIQEASEDITEGKIMFSCPKASYMEANTQKDEETKIYAPKRTLMCPEHGPCTPSMG